MGKATRTGSFTATKFTEKDCGCDGDPSQKDHR